jgi:hypothetical protein
VVFSNSARVRIMQTMMDISIFRRAAEQFNREKARVAFCAPAKPAKPAPAPAPKKATAPPAPAQTKPAPRTPTAAEREAERKDNCERREREYEKMLAFVHDPSTSPFAHLANYGAPEIVHEIETPFVAGHGSDAAEWQPHVADPAAMARKIVDAAALARSGGHERPKPEGMAKQIIAAGARARDVEPELPHDLVARAIVLAGMRRRNEIE